MADTMVAARVPQEKKESVARKLAQMDSSVSQAINQLFDYIDRNNCLPFDEDAQDSRESRRAEALAWLEQLPRLPEGNCYQSTTDEEIKLQRLRARGYSI